MASSFKTFPQMYTFLPSCREESTSVPIYDDKLRESNYNYTVDVDSVANAEMVERMTDSLLSEDGNSPVTFRTPVFIKTLVDGTLGAMPESPTISPPSFSNSIFESHCQKFSPTSVLESPDWEILFEAASHVQQQALQQEIRAFGGHLERIPNLQNIQAALQDSRSNYRIPPTHFQNQQSSKSRIFKKSTERGQFLDVTTSVRASESQSHPYLTVNSVCQENLKPVATTTTEIYPPVQSSKVSRKQRNRTPTSVMLPARMVMAFGLEVDSENNVVPKHPVVNLKRLASGGRDSPQEGDSNSYVVQVKAPAMKMVSNKEAAAMSKWRDRKPGHAAKAPHQ